MKGTRRFLTGANTASKSSKNRGKWLAESEEGRSINNLWTGKELGGKGKAAAFTAIGGYFGYQALEGPNAAITQSQYEQDDIQSLPGTQGDGLGYTAFPSSNLQDFAPSGDLVFALHRLRHGG